LKLTKIHRGIKFRESNKLGKYIGFNTKKRMEAQAAGDKVGVDFFKLMNLSVYGKTIENVSNRVDIRFVTNEGDAEKLSAQSNYNRRTIIDEDFVAVHSSRTHATDSCVVRQTDIRGFGSDGFVKGVNV